ncbi:metal ABC transporter substrate-binding protein [Azospira restricta]|uniref:Zinc ABC transporter substrate-binding protein n=1 Tax=Azospira restricta TaxID=404405 RepID=A0A974SQU9_9RHOO|nr:zinc ABC transporter substrate-binding protein [Azospira restricta]QRJ64831.1 zinc ABC transporter substrate-binding protein [Azospira restricta]
MKRFLLIGLAAALLSLPAQAALKVFATVPEWAALAQEIGGGRVTVYAATHGLQDPHRIEAKPSLIARARSAQLVVATGAELEVGWLPVVLRESGNRDIQPGRPGYFEAASAVRLLDVPAVLDRAHGDVHAAGNPHIQTDPRNILKVAEALAARMAELDPAEAAAYRSGFAAFAEKWRAALVRWEKIAAPLKGVPVLVQHNAFPYLNAWLGLREVGTLEPRPGVEPSGGHLADVLAKLTAQPARMVLRPAYQHDAPSRWIAERAKIPAVIVPFTVGGTPEAGDLVALFDDTLRRLLAALAAR